MFIRCTLLRLLSCLCGSEQAINALVEMGVLLSCLCGSEP